jgi:hypothetical protein
MIRKKQKNPIIKIMELIIITANRSQSKTDLTKDVTVNRTVRAEE